MAVMNGVTVNCITDKSIKIIGTETMGLTKTSSYTTLLGKQLSHQSCRKYWTG
jgi:hypothetical protein